MKSRYDNISDEELIMMVINDNNDDAMSYLLYERYIKTLRYHTMHLFGNLFYLDDLIVELFCYLKGNDKQWKKLKSFNWNSRFVTWLSTVSYNLFLRKRSELMDFSSMMESIESEKVLKMEFMTDKNKADKIVMIYDAIAQLDTSDETERDYKFVLIKDLEGFTAAEIAKMLYKKRKKENRIKIDPKNEKEIIPDTDYIYMIKSRATKRIKEIIFNEAKITMPKIDDELMAKYIDNKVSRTERRKVVGFITENPMTIENMLYLMDEDWEENGDEKLNEIPPSPKKIMRMENEDLGFNYATAHNIIESCSNRLCNLFDDNESEYEHQICKIPASRSREIIEHLMQLLK